MANARIDELVATVRGFVDSELIPIERKLIDGSTPSDADLVRLRDRARSLGIWSLGAPSEYGGGGLGTFQLCLLVEEMTRTTATGPWLGAGVFGEVAPNLLAFAGNEDQRERFLRPVVRDGRSYFFAMSEPGAGSDPTAIQTTAQRVDGGWVLNGQKGLVGWVKGADFGFVFASSISATAEIEGLTCFIVPTDSSGFHYGDEVDSHAGIPVGYIRFTDCFVPDFCVLGEVGRGLLLGQTWLGRMRTILYGAGMLGPCVRAIELAVEYAKEHSTFGVALSDRQAVQFMLADCVQELTMARLLVHDTANKLDQGDSARIQVAMTKISGTETATRIIDRCLQIHGGIGLTSLLPLEQFLRTARMLRITEGPNEVHRWFIARQLIR